MRKTGLMHKIGRRAGTGACPYIGIFILFFALLFGCSGDDADGSARFTLKTPAFPEIQEMISKVTVSLEIAGKTCLITLDADWTLSGQCPGIPTGSHSFTSNYLRPDLGITIASATGNITLESGKQTTLTVQTLTKQQDDDGDQHSNLLEAMFGSDPNNPASKPPLRPFSAFVTYNVGNEPTALALGLLNGDTILDVVSANFGDDTVTVLLGNANGTFQSGVSYRTGPLGGEPRDPFDLVLKDLNDDGRLDIIVANTGTTAATFKGDVVVLLGNSDGTFQSAVSFSVGNQPLQIALGDLNGDEFQDLVSANQSSQNISVLKGKTGGAFDAGVFPSIGASGAVTALALGKVDGDAFLDLVATVQDSQSIIILRGKGDGTFQAPTSIQVGQILSVALADLNGDNKLDIVAAITAKTIAVLLGNGDGSFQTQVLYKAGQTPGSLAIGDLDGDGALDLVTENETDGVIAILMGNLDGTFRGPVFLEAGSSPSRVGLGDLNGDGSLDIVASDRANGTVMVFLTK